jgi:hypothetical protein
MTISDMVPAAYHYCPLRVGRPLRGGYTLSCRNDLLWSLPLVGIDISRQRFIRGSLGTEGAAECSESFDDLCGPLRELVVA